MVCEIVLVVEFGYRFAYLFGIWFGYCCLLLLCGSADLGCGVLGLLLCCCGIALLVWCDLVRFSGFGCWLLLVLIVSGFLWYDWCFGF